MIRVLDETARLQLASGARVARNPWARFRGLMLRRRLHPGEGLVIRPCSSIHMCFMLFPIDAVFFDTELRVTHVARGVPPWVGLAFGRRGAQGVLELPKGSAGGTRVGHQLAFIPAAASDEGRLRAAA